MSNKEKFAAKKTVKLIFSVMKSIRDTGSLALKRRSGCTATLFSYCAGMKITSEAKFPIYQKPSMAHRVTWSKTAASIEMLNDVEKPLASLRIIPIWFS